MAKQASAEKSQPDTSTQSTSTSKPEENFADLRKATEEAPDGYQKQTGDAKAFWDPDLCNIVCIPRSAKLFDGNQDPKKPSMMIVVELLARLPMRLAKEKGAPKEAKGDVIVCNPGDMIGIWGKPGMRDIRDMCGAKVWVKRLDERLDVGKGQPMVQYDVRGPKRGARIPVVEDQRKLSAGVPTFLDVKLPSKSSSDQRDHSPGEDDDIPF